MLCVRALLIALLTVPMVATAAPACPPDGWTGDQLRSLRATKFKLDNPGQRGRLAFELLPCLRSPDPVLRDETAFAALSTWLRAGDLNATAARELGLLLQAALLQPDDDGFGPAFAALALSEVARLDRLQPLWSPEERDTVVTLAANYMRSIQDYRGFDPEQGWRHAVAHAADLLMQLALNPMLDRGELDRLLDAVASQVLAGGRHFYIHGESERLLRPVVFIARRQLHNETEWSAWFGKLSLTAMPAPGAPTTLEGLALRHNARGFFYPLYAALQEGGDAEMRKRLLPGLVAAVRTLN